MLGKRISIWTMQQCSPDDDDDIWKVAHFLFVKNWKKDCVWKRAQWMFGSIAFILLLRPPFQNLSRKKTTGLRPWSLSTIVIRCTYFLLNFFSLNLSLFSHSPLLSWISPNGVSSILRPPVDRWSLISLSLSPNCYFKSNWLIAPRTAKKWKYKNGINFLCSSIKTKWRQLKRRFCYRCRISRGFDWLTPIFSGRRWPLKYITYKWKYWDA